jgi:hypothetical protein
VRWLDEHTAGVLYWLGIVAGYHLSRIAKWLGLVK